MNDNTNVTTTTVVEQPTNQPTNEEKVDETNQPVNDSNEESATDNPTTPQNEDEVLKQRNAEFARKRREKEAEEQKFQKIREEAYQKGLVEAVGGVNPYTLEKIETQEDIEEYLLMREIEANGKDPIMDYSKFLKTKKTKQKENQTKNDKNHEEWVAKDIEEFKKTYPDVDILKVIEDKEINEYFDKFTGQVPLKDIYETYNKWQEKQKSIIQEKAEQLATELYAKKLASPGAVKQTKETAQSEYFTLDEIKKMSQEEVTKNWAKVEKSYSYHLGKKK